MLSIGGQESDGLRSEHKI